MEIKIDIRVTHSQRIGHLKPKEWAICMPKRETSRETNPANLANPELWIHEAIKSVKLEGNLGK